MTDLPPTAIVVKAIENALPAVRRATEIAGDITIADRAFLDELGRILARCILRDMTEATK